jgi:hypothetical protein
VLEVLVGETVTVSPSGLPVDSISADAGNPSAPTITGLGIAAINTAGSYRFTVTVAGVPTDLWLRCVETACITAVPDFPPGRGETTRSALTAAQKRLVIRSIANDPTATWFASGTAASLANRSLYSYGA